MKIREKNAKSFRVLNILYIKLRIVHYYVYAFQPIVIVHTRFVLLFAYEMIRLIKTHSRQIIEKKINVLFDKS